MNPKDHVIAETGMEMNMGMEPSNGSNEMGIEISVMDALDEDKEDHREAAAPTLVVLPPPAKVKRVCSQGEPSDDMMLKCHVVAEWLNFMLLQPASW